MTENPERQTTAGAPAPVRRTRLGGLWVVLALGAVILVLLLVFILQNGQRVEIHMYGGHLTAPLGVALLMAAALGVLLVVVPGAGRIIQLRRAARRMHRERETLAGRLDEMTGATDPGTAPGQPAGAPAQQPDGQVAAPAPGQAPDSGQAPASAQQPRQSQGEQPPTQQPPTGR